MADKSQESQWLTSAEARKFMSISTCDLAHLRDAGKLRFKKKGNAYLYHLVDCRRHAGESDAGSSCRINSPES